jgi:hypothetical protein
MCMVLDGDSLTNDEIANAWKEVTASSPDVEQHRLKCVMPSNVTSAIINSSIDGVSGIAISNLSDGLNFKAKVI